MPDKLKDVLAMEPPERDGERNEMGWSPCHCPTTDYAVLCRVRETWKSPAVNLFYDDLVSIWHRRYLATDEGKLLGYEPDGGSDAWLATMYEPGDYAAAALSVLLSTTAAGERQGASRE